MTVIKFSKQFNFSLNQLANIFLLLSFSLAQPRTKAESLNSQQVSKEKIKTKSGICVNYRGNIIQRNTDVDISVLKILPKICSNKVDFQYVIFNFSKVSCGLVELGPLRFIWHHDLRVTHCQSIAMFFLFFLFISFSSFFFTNYSFCNSFKHCLFSDTCSG